MEKISIILLTIILIQTGQAQETSELKWWNPANSEFPVVASQGWPDEVASRYDRLPARAENIVSEDIWALSRQSAGLSIRFWSNADTIHVRYKLNGDLSYPHFSATGLSGLDLYSKSYHGEWMRNWGSYVIDSTSQYKFSIVDPSEEYQKYGKEYQLFLPLFNQVTSLEIGIDRKWFFEPLPARREKPIVAYGTSITQGAIVSRSGMAWTTQLERKLERPVINLGFAGMGRFEPELIDLISEIDAKLYILDCLHNLNSEKDDTYQLALDAIKKLRAKRPDIPIILTEHLGFADAATNQKRSHELLVLNQALNDAFNQLKSEGYTQLFLLQKEDLAHGITSFTDYIHPNDYGMIQYAQAYELLIRKVLNEPKGKTPTTIPLTQCRDISVYKWEDRHQQILELNKANPPKICLFGNSIINFWGGEPGAAIQNGKDSWERIMKPLNVRNFGFGYDLIENVLWRIYHDELDGFEAEQVVLMIGTNNTSFNHTDTEIVIGLGQLVQAVRIRQPKSRIVMIGILPRTEGEVRIEKLNQKIAQMAGLNQIEFHDIGEPLLLKNGKTDESLYKDGLHPNGKGYKIIATQLQEILKNR